RAGPAGALLPGLSSPRTPRRLPFLPQLQRVFYPGGREARPRPWHLEGPRPDLPLPPLASRRLRPAVTLPDRRLASRKLWMGIRIFDRQPFYACCRIEFCVG